MKGIDPKYQWILDEYPEIITKEQLYKICHVSKKTALHYLVNGLIPCTSTGTANRCHALSDQAYEYITSVADGLAELDDPDQPDIIV